MLEGTHIKNVSLGDVQIRCPAVWTDLQTDYYLKMDALVKFFLCRLLEKCRVLGLMNQVDAQ